MLCEGYEFDILKSVSPPKSMMCHTSGKWWMIERKFHGRECNNCNAGRIHLYVSSSSRCTIGVEGQSRADQARSPEGSDDLVWSTKLPFFLLDTRENPYPRHMDLQNWLGRSSYRKLLCATEVVDRAVWSTATSHDSSVFLSDTVVKWLRLTVHRRPSIRNVYVTFALAISFSSENGESCSVAVFFYQQITY